MIVNRMIRIRIRTFRFPSDLCTKEREYIKDCNHSRQAGGGGEGVYETHIKRVVSMNGYESPWEQ